MNAIRNTAVALAAGIIVIGGLALLEKGSTWTVPSLISKAEAKVGRPLTPVSVAGVARRTARRCANGTYNC